MKFGVDCPACRATMQVAEQYAGKRGRCPRCLEIFTVPAAPAAAPAGPEIPPDEADTYGLEGAPTAGASARMAAARASASATAARRPEAAAPTRPTRSPVQILAAFRGEIATVRPSLMYRLWILIIALAMVLLPTLYLGLIGLVGYGVYLHAVSNHVLLRTSGHALKFAAVAYLAPMIAGAVVVAFMLKPLFAGAGKRAKVRRIDPSKEPLIAAFVDGVCSSVGAPTPARIEVDCQVNASAHLASWVLSPSKELVLTIGLPLVAGLTLRQFTGVLAHEFGHFSQGAGMRLSRLIRSINLWFARVVYERDEWDETLAGWSSGDNHPTIMLLGYLVRASVWLTRRVLWVLMYVARLVSGFLSRQMEFDADRYQARMVGGETLARTMERVNELGLAWNAAHGELQSSWRERRLPDDLPRLVTVEASKIPEPMRAFLRASMEQGRTGLFDTHPADRERIARALREGPEGIFRLDGPATDLFRDFDALARSTTFDYYRSMLGREVTKEQLFPIDVALLDQEVQREGSEAFDRFFLDGLGPVQSPPLPDSYPPPPADPKAAKRALVEARRAMLAAFEGDRDSRQRWYALHDRAGKAQAAAILLRVGKKSINPADYGLEKARLPLAEAALAEAVREIEAVESDLKAFATVASDRLATALGLLELDVVASRVPEGPTRREEARALYASAAVLGTRVVPELGKLLRAMHSSGLVVSLYHAGKNDQDEAMINALLRSGRLIHEALTELKWKLGDAVAYPFEHARDGMTLGRYALGMLPDPQAVGDLLQAGSEAQDRIFALNRRVLGRLAATAEAVEKAVGLKPLEIPRQEAGPGDA